MKMKALSLVVGATLGAAAMQASADALLAPYFKLGPGAVTTVFLMKSMGYGVERGKDNNDDPDVLHNVHAYYFWKPDRPIPPGAPIEPYTGFSVQTTPCKIDDATSKFSSWDLGAFDLAGTNLITGDQTRAPSFVVPNVEGFAIFVEEDINDAGELVDEDSEGNFSGMGYVVNISASSFIDYKLLNNPNDVTGNDWDDATVSKDIIDMMWWPTSAMWTMWPTIVTGENMLTSPASFNSEWAGAVRLRGYNWNATDYAGNQNQIYDNDEGVWSGPVNKDIVCAGQVTREEIMTTNAEINTRNGGWARIAVEPRYDYLCNPLNQNCGSIPVPTSATGVIMQKWEYALPGGPLAWSIEASGTEDDYAGWAGPVANHAY